MLHRHRPFVPVGTEEAGVYGRFERMDGEAGGVTSQQCHHRPRAHYSESRAGAAKKQAFCQQVSAQRTGANITAIHDPEADHLIPSHMGPGEGLLLNDLNIIRKSDD